MCKFNFVQLVSFILSFRFLYIKFITEFKLCKDKCIQFFSLTGWLSFWFSGHGHLNCIWKTFTNFVQYLKRILIIENHWDNTSTYHFKVLWSLFYFLMVATADVGNIIGEQAMLFLGAWIVTWIVDQHCRNMGYCVTSFSPCFAADNGWLARVIISDRKQRSLTHDKQQNTDTSNLKLEINQKICVFFFLMMNQQ